MAHPTTNSRRTEPAASKATHNAAPSGRQAANGPNASRKTAAQTGGASASRSKGDSSKGDPKMIGPWRIGRTIGKGSSGQYIGSMVSHQADRLNRESQDRQACSHLSASCCQDRAKACPVIKPSEH